MEIDPRDIGHELMPCMVNCARCGIRIAYLQTDVISALNSKSHRIEFYCATHMSDVLKKINLFISDIKWIAENYFGRPATVSEVFSYSLTKDLLLPVDNDKTTKTIYSLGKRFNTEPATSVCANWAESIRTQPPYSDTVHHFVPVIPIRTTKNDLIFAN